jgi:outer membrane receptor protein involved in Fe transport
MKRALAFMFFLFLTGTLLGQDMGSIHGKVYSSLSAYPLGGAFVVISGSGKGTVTDSKGQFEFNNLSEGKYILKFSYVGFSTDSVIVKLNSGEAVKTNKTLFPASIAISEVIVTATRTEKTQGSVPAKVEVISANNIEKMPFVSTDEILSLSPGINASRNYGIYNKTGDVTLRGLNRNVHTLLLMDGVPLSLLDGSAANWNRIDPDNIEKIEIVKGPNSSLYGGNAMGGVINIITRKPQETFSGSVRAFYGTYNTSGGRLIMNARTGHKDNHYLYATVDGFVRQSDGYIMTPEDIRDSTDVDMFVNEYNAGLKAGYAFSKRESVEAEYRYSYDSRGNGTELFELGGNLNKYKTHYARARYCRSSAKGRLEADVFYKRENYLKQNESMKTSGLYYYYHTYSITQDEGLWFSWSKVLPAKQELTIGADFKMGSTENADVYHTSTDTVNYGGSMGFYGIFIQDQIALLKGKLNIIAGLRVDAVNFNHGSFDIQSPSLATEYMAPYQGDFGDTTWFALSPRVGLQWNFNENKRIYIDWSRGFRPGTLSDLCKTGDVNKGFKLANPSLSPESIDEFELGSVLKFFGKVNFEPAIFYSIGHNFQYFVGTGDSMYTSGTKLKPIIRRENIGEVHIYGAELKIDWQINTNFDFIFCYSYSHSRIADYDLGSYIGKDLTGLSLIEVPENILFARLHWKNRFVNVALGAKHNDKEWVDDENTQRTDPYFLLDLKLYRTFLKRITTSLTIQNILNNRFTDSKGLLSPGRYIIAEVKVNF